MNRERETAASENHFESAGGRRYIPRTGFFPDAKYQLSAGPRTHVSLAQLTEIPLDHAGESLTRMWSDLLVHRRLAAGFGIPAIEPLSYLELPVVAFAPTTQQLFNEIIVPAIKEHCIKTGKINQLAVEEIGYPLPFWAKDNLLPVGIVEGKSKPAIETHSYATRLQEYVQTGAKLPDGIGAVYLDFPSTLNTTYTRRELIQFIRNNSSVLFIIDQANLYFSSPPNERAFDTDNDLMLTGKYIAPGIPDKQEERLIDTDLVLVTNTTTKAMGVSGCAIVTGTTPAKNLLYGVFGNQLPLVQGFDQKSFMRARQALEQEAANYSPFEKNHNTLKAINYRELVSKNKKRLVENLQTLFGHASFSPELASAGPHIFINAQSLGFDKAQSLCDALYNQFSIATKPASVYTNPEKHPEYDKYVYMAIPMDHEAMQAVLNAFKVIHQ